MPSPRLRAWLSRLAFLWCALWVGTALAAEPEPASTEQSEPELNPYECLGRYQAATGNRTIAQIEGELKKRLATLNEPGEPKSVKAMKLCVIAMLKSRIGDGDADDYYERAIKNDPDEPGYELWAGMYWSGFRGARSPVLELAERHYYRALEKLERLRKKKRYRPYHQIVEDWTRKRLMVLYQQDGLHLIPGKAYEQNSSGLDMPGLAASVQFGISADTREFNRRGDNNEMRVFSGERDFANSDLRAGGAARPVLGRGLTDREIWDIPRAPLRRQLELRGRTRHNFIGAIDFSYLTAHSEKSQITSFYFPTGATPQEPTGQSFSNFDIQELGVGAERVIPLYPLFDLKIAGGFRRVKRKGAIEFLPEREENFNLYEGRPSFSRFIGSDKLTLDLVYSLLDVTDALGGPEFDRLREKHIRAATLEYALYSPLVLPKFELGSLGSYRTPTRGWYFFGGIMQDDEAYGTRTLSKRDLFLGSRFEGPTSWDFSLQGTYGTSSMRYADPETARVFTDSTQEFANFRTSAYVAYRIVNPDALPGVAALDMLNLVFPITHDLGITGRKDYENIRAGAQIWMKLFGTPLLGPPFLITAGYDYQYFYQIQKSMHLFQVNLRMGWGEL